MVCPNLPDSIHPSIHPSVRSSVRLSVRPSIHPSFCSFFHPPIYPSIHPFIHSLLFFFFFFLRYLIICAMRAPTVNVREFMSFNLCKIAFANLAVHVPNADNLTWCGAKRSSNFFSFFLFFSFQFFSFLKKTRSWWRLPARRAKPYPTSCHKLQKHGEHAEVSS